VNLQELRAKLREKVGNPSVAEVPDTTLDALNNEAYEEIHDKYVFHKARKIVTFPTVASSELYQVPADCLAVFSVWNTTASHQRKLEKKDENWLATQQDAEDGDPLAYVVQRGWIQLVPTPDAVYTMRLMYKSHYTAMTLDTDTPVIPLSWHPGIWRLARFNYWDQKGDLAKAQWTNGVWKQWVVDKPDELQEEYQMDNTEGVVMPSLIRSSSESTVNSQSLWDRE